MFVAHRIKDDVRQSWAVWVKFTENTVALRTFCVSVWFAYLSTWSFMSFNVCIVPGVWCRKQSDDCGNFYHSASTYVVPHLFTFRSKIKLCFQNLWRCTSNAYRARLQRRLFRFHSLSKLENLMIEPPRGAHPSLSHVKEQQNTHAGSPWVTVIMFLQDTLLK